MHLPIELIATPNYSCVMLLLPPSGLSATLSEATLDRRHTSSISCPWVSPDPENEACADSRFSRRGFLSAAGAALLAFGATRAEAAVGVDRGMDVGNSNPSAIQSGFKAEVPGAIPDDFWERPRTLTIQRAGSGSPQELTYWKNGKIVPSEYWQICAILRDVRANVMTTIDPGLLDVLRGVQGYYDAWGWPQHLVITSGFRTVATNRALSREGSAKNSFHVKGQAVDMYIPGVPPRDVALLGMHLKQGGVGFYPTKGFTHLDTGTLRTWRG